MIVDSIRLPARQMEYGGLVYGFYAVGMLSEEERIKAESIHKMPLSGKTCEYVHMPNGVNPCENPNPAGE